jgi:hypothetical protein
MIGDKQRRFVEKAGQKISASVQTAIVRLAEAHDYARDVQCDSWEFAVGIAQIKAIGLSDDDLHWLVANGYVKHKREITKRSDIARKFSPSQDLKFTKTTCFVATAAGLRLTVMESAGSKLQKAA